MAKRAGTDYGYTSTFVSYEKLDKKIDAFRRKQKVLPSRAAAIRHLIEIGLAKEMGTPKAA